MHFTPTPCSVWKQNIIVWWFNKAYHLVYFNHFLIGLNALGISFTIIPQISFLAITVQLIAFKQIVPPFHS